MPDSLEIDPDFAEQMQGLVQEAEMALGSREGRPAEKSADKSLAIETDAAPSPASPAAPQQSVADMLRPVVMGLQAIGRTSGEHGQILMRLDKAAKESNEAEKALPGVVAELRYLIDQRSAVSRQMFDALHEELKSYKDGFLLDTVHRPMIRDLITLYDDLSLIHHQMKEPIETSATFTHEVPAKGTEFVQKMVSIALHIEHNLDFILEVLARLDVSQMPIVKGKLDKMTQRAVAVEAAEDPDDDLTVVRTVKRGFTWKDRVVRAEEVVIKKWKEGFLMALKSTED